MVDRHGRACSNAAHAASTRASACRGPTTCSPTGNPAEVNPHGTVAAGCCVMLNGYVNGVHPVHRVAPDPGGTSTPASNAGIGIVGVIYRS